MGKKKINFVWKNYNYKIVSIIKVYTSFLTLPNPPGELTKKLEKLFYKFLWNTGPDRIKRSIVIKDLVAGGLRMINMNALKISLSLNQESIS